MARRKSSELTLVQVAYARARQSGAGTLKAYKLASDAVQLPVCLAIAQVKGAAADGGWPTQAEYARFWGLTDRTAQREWARYREVFGPDARPEELARQLVAEYGRRLAEGERGNPALVMSAPASLLPA